MSRAREADPDVASKVAGQLYTNALVAAGLLDDPRSMIPNVNDLMVQVLAPYATAAPAAEEAEAKAEAKAE